MEEDVLVLLPCPGPVRRVWGWRQWVIHRALGPDAHWRRLIRLAVLARGTQLGRARRELFWERVGQLLDALDEAWEKASSSEVASALLGGDGRQLREEWERSGHGLNRCLEAALERGGTGMQSHLVLVLNAEWASARYRPLLEMLVGGGCGQVAVHCDPDVSAPFPTLGVDVRSPLSPFCVPRARTSGWAAPDEYQEVEWLASWLQTTGVDPGEVSVLVPRHRHPTVAFVLGRWGFPTVGQWVSPAEHNRWVEVVWRAVLAAATGSTAALGRVLQSALVGMPAASWAEFRRYRQGESASFEDWEEPVSQLAPGLREKAAFLLGLLERCQKDPRQLWALPRKLPELVDGPERARVQEAAVTVVRLLEVARDEGWWAPGEDGHQLEALEPLLWIPVTPQRHEEYGVRILDYPQVWAAGGQLLAVLGMGEVTFHPRLLGGMDPACWWRLITLAADRVVCSWPRRVAEGRLQGSWEGLPALEEAEGALQDAEDWPRLARSLPLDWARYMAGAGESKEDDRHTLARDVTQSASALATYLECPRQYYYLHRLGITPAPHPEAVLGLVVHAALARLHAQLPDPTACPEAQLRATAERALKAAWEEYRGQWRGPRQATAYLRVAQDIVAGYLRAVLARWEPGRMVQSTETRFQVDLGGWRMVGRMDRIDRLPEGGVELVDYKCSRWDRKSALALKRGFTEVARPEELGEVQIPLYCLGAERGLGLAVRAVSIIQLRNLDRQGLPRVRRLWLEAAPSRRSRRQVVVSRREVEAAGALIAALAQKAASGPYPARPKGGAFACQRCPVALVCDGRPEEEEEALDHE